jgi:hypothetical protein
MYNHTIETRRAKAPTHSIHFGEPALAPFYLVPTGRSVVLVLPPAPEERQEAPEERREAPQESQAGGEAL